MGVAREFRELVPCQRNTEPIWAAIRTPFQSSHEIDEDGLRYNVRRYIDIGLRGAFWNGLMGDVWALSNEERKRVVEILCDESGGQLGMYGGGQRIAHVFCVIKY